MKRQGAKPKSHAEECFAMAWQACCSTLPAPEREHRFHPERRWLLDFAWPGIKLAVEIEGRGKGGAHGGHHSVTGARRDCEKSNELVRLGWRVLRFPATDKAEAQQWAEYVCEMMCYAQ